MKKKTLYIIITLLVLLNIGQFVYFYSVVSDLKVELRVKRGDLNEGGDDETVSGGNVAPGGDDETVPGGE